MGSREQTKAQTIRRSVGGPVGYLGNLLTGGYWSKWFGPAIDATFGTDATEGGNTYAVGIGDAFPVADALTDPLVSYNTYRLIAAHPTVVICHANTTMPVYAAGWGIDVDNRRAPRQAQALIESAVMPWRLTLLHECMRALRYGWQSFELVFASDAGGWTTLKKPKPLLPDLTTILVDEHGNLTGLRNQNIDLKAEKTLVFTYDAEGGSFYGRSRLENVRRAWANWLNDDDNLSRLAKKAASTVPYIGYPAGKSRTSADRNAPGTGGELTGNARIAADLAQQMARGRGIIYPNHSGLEIDDIMQVPELAKASLWSFQTLEMGNPGPMASAVIDAMRYLDALICRGYHRPERSIIEASVSGSRADSESHADGAIGDSDYLHLIATEAVQKQIVDRLMLMNFGPDAVGTVKLVAKPIADGQKLVDQKLLDAVLRSEKSMGELIKYIDMDAWFARTGLPKNERAGEWEVDSSELAPTGDPDDRDAEAHLSAMLARGDWDESRHPRDVRGQWRRSGISRTVLRSKAEIQAVVRKAYRVLRDAGVSREHRQKVIKAFDVRTLVIRKAGAAEVGIRYFDHKQASPRGRFLFETFPASRDSLALKTDWNQMTGMKQWRIRPGATVLEGATSPQRTASSQSTWRGGQTQKYVLDPKRDLLEL